MRSYTVPTLTAMALGLCLASGTALARDGDRDRDRGDRGNVTRQDDNNDRGNRRERRRPEQQQQQAPQQQQIQQRRGWDGNRDGDRRTNWNNDRRDRDVRNNDRRDRNWDNNRRDRNWSDNDRRDRRFDNNNRRRNWSQFRRSYDSPRRFRIGVYRAPSGYHYRRWGHGERLPRAYYARNYWLTNFVVYGLFAPPPGLMWVRYGPDALLVDTYTGEIVQVRYNAFYY